MAGAQRRRAVLAALFVTALAFGPLATGSPAPVDHRFVEVSWEAGLDYAVASDQPVRRGGAVYVTDFNDDGWPDVLTLGGVSPALFENTGGEFERSGALPSEPFRGRYMLSALAFDYDNDGWEDLLFVPIRGEPIFLENVGGEFERRDVGLDVGPLVNSFSSTTADYDRDGCLDLLVLQNGDWSETQPAGEKAPNSSVDDDNGNPNLLFRGTCGSFERVDAGVDGERWSLAASFVDFTGDGYPDVHVANDYNYDYLYVNRGDGSFEARQLPDATNRNGMASEVFDANGDGRLDVFVTNIYFDVGGVSQPLVADYLRDDFGRRVDGGNNLLLNRGNGTFVDAGREYGVARGGWGWAASAGDFDNDGDVDVVHATKRFRRSFWPGDADVRFPYTSYFERTGETFTYRNGSSLGFDAVSGLGVARLDYDRDGDLDLLVGPYRTGHVRLYENRGVAGSWLQVALASDGAGPTIGARVYVTTDDGTQMRVQNARADYLSQDTRVLHFGLGSAHRVDRVRVVWPDGSERVLTGVPANRRVTVVRGGDGTKG
ncbi:MAG: CRTAC1 family protein [Halobacteriaceae archaeon]